MPSSLTIKMPVVSHDKFVTSRIVHMATDCDITNLGLLFCRIWPLLITEKFKHFYLHWGAFHWFHRTPGRDFTGFNCCIILHTSSCLNSCTKEKFAIIELTHTVWLPFGKHSLKVLLDLYTQAGQRFKNQSQGFDFHSSLWAELGVGGVIRSMLSLHMDSA